MENNNIHRIYFPRSLNDHSVKVRMSFRLRSHRSRLFGYTVYVFVGTRILEIKHYDFLMPGHIGGHYSKVRIGAYRCV